MNKILYSICSISHLSYFKTMTDSFLINNKEYRIVLFLIDKIRKGIDLNLDQSVIIIEIDKIGIENFNEIHESYNILELSCAMKPFAANYLFNTYKPDLLLYLDTDILVFDNFSHAEGLLLKNDIILTPHIFSEINDSLIPKESDFLNAGIFNAGFFMLKNTDNVLVFLKWWQMRMVDQCRIDFNNGLMLDQNWLNFVPYFFDKVCICEHLGYNYAYWNFHERNLDLINAKYFINKEFPLIFIHISGFDLNFPENISKHQNRFSLDNYEFLLLIYNNYFQSLKSNDFDYYIEMKSFYEKKIHKSTGLLKYLNKVLMIFRFKLVNLN